MNVLEAARRLLASRPLAELGRWVEAAPTTLVVGGALRDLLLGRTVTDLDLVVIGKAEPLARRIAGFCDGHPFLLGAPPRAVWRVIAASFTVDVWELQESLQHDAMRRDFSVNALMWRLPRGPLLDLAGGLDDLAAGTLRVIDRRNLVEDPIRVLRGLRMLATHPELALTSDAAAQLSDAAAALVDSPGERVRLEMETLLSGVDPRRALLAGHRLGILQILDPAWGNPRSARAAARLADRLAVLRRGANGWLRAAVDDAFPTALAFPAAGPLSSWCPADASGALMGFGWPPRSAARLGAVGSHAQLLASALRRRVAADQRAAAVGAGSLLEPSLALATAVTAHATDLHARIGRLRSWARRFGSRPALLDGAEIAAVLDLPPGPRRAREVHRLRLAQARGEVRTRRGAVAWLRRQHGR